MAKKEKDNGTRNLILGIIIGVVVIGAIFIIYNSSITGNSISNFESQNPPSQNSQGGNSQNNVNENSYVEKCGDGVCQSSESCSSCSKDCGVCCSDECSYSGSKCVGNSVYSCYDNNGDGCKEEISEPCSNDEKCENGRCIQKVHDLRVENEQCTVGGRTASSMWTQCENTCWGDVVNYGDYVENTYKVNILTTHENGQYLCTNWKVSGDALQPGERYQYHADTANGCCDEDDFQQQHTIIDWVKTG